MVLEGKAVLITGGTGSLGKTLVRRLLTTNFSGEATNVVEALMTAADDIERIMESGELGHNVKPRIGLLTDGRATRNANAKEAGDG